MFNNILISFIKFVVRNEKLFTMLVYCITGFITVVVDACLLFKYFSDSAIVMTGALISFLAILLLENAIMSLSTEMVLKYCKNMVEASH